MSHSQSSTGSNLPSVVFCPQILEQFIGGVAELASTVNGVQRRYRIVGARYGTANDKTPLVTFNLTPLSIATDPGYILGPWEAVQEPPVEVVFRVGATTPVDPSRPEPEEVAYRLWPSEGNPGRTMVLYQPDDPDLDTTAFPGLADRQLVVMRHGGYVGRGDDASLSERGRDETRAAAAAMAAAAMAGGMTGSDIVVCSSPLRRVMETADTLSQHLAACMGWRTPPLILPADWLADRGPYSVMAGAEIRAALRLLSPDTTLVLVTHLPVIRRILDSPGVTFRTGEYRTIALTPSTT